MHARRVRVLHVEDNPREAGIVQEMLDEAASMRFEITHRDRVRDAIAILAPGAFDLVLLDLSLPDSRGLETFERVHAHCSTVPIIVLTNHVDEEMGTRAVHGGAQDYLVKQETEPSLLLRSIRYALERAAAEEALRESEERFALAIRGANDGIWDWDLRRRSIFFSPRWKSMLGFDEHEIGDDPLEWFERVHPDDRNQLTAALEAHIDGETPHFEMEYRIRHKEGAYHWMLARGLAVRDGSGRAYRMAGSQTDITARKRAEAQLLHDAFHDALTGLANRALFLDRLHVALGSVRRKKNGQFAVLFLDLDRFKNVNDSLGHATGDRLLTAIARRLRTFLRPGDTLARLGGDEFAILVNDIVEPSDAIHVAERVQDLLAQKFIIDGQEVFVTASIGIALSSTGYDRPDELLRDADISMYRAKAAGKNRYEIFDRDMHRSAVALLRLEMDLRRAIQRNEFVMHYQPIIDLDPGRMVGFEGLVRWRHPERGLVAPADFIAVAEETGLIVPLGWWVLEESCRQISEWQARYPAEPPLTVSVNVSGKLFMQEGMVDRIASIVEGNRLDPESLRLEITENVLLDHGDPALHKMAELRAMGVKLQVDDFGTGYSSINYLKRLPLEIIKIDREFVLDLFEEKNDEIVKMVVSTARIFGLKTVAEGVETEETFEYLRKIGCDYYQGFLFSAAVAPEEIERKWLEGEVRGEK